MVIVQIGLRCVQQQLTVTVSGMHRWYYSHTPAVLYTALSGTNLLTAARNHARYGFYRAPARQHDKPLLVLLLYRP